MSHVNPVQPVREYINTLVHSSGRSDPLTAARHRGFIGPRLIAGLIALALLPVYLVARGGLSFLEAAVFGWFVLPIALAAYLSRTGDYDRAQMLWSLTLAMLIVGAAAATGGLASPFAWGLALLPVEGALAPSRRIAAIATGLALSGAGLLLALGTGGLDLLPPAMLLTPLQAVAVIAAAAFYVASSAMAAGTLARAGTARISSIEERYRFLALNMTDGMTRHARGGIVVSASPATERLFGVSGSTLMGHGLFDRVHVSDRPAYLSALSGAGLGGGTGSVEFRARRHVADNEPDIFIWIEMHCRSLAPDIAAGGLVPDYDVVAVMRDITDRRQQEAVATEARREAETANIAKGRFLATMSHELRTPLNAVIGFSEMLIHEEEMQIDAAKRREYARLIHDSGQHLLSVVNLVLDMSKIETGHFVITPEAVAPAPVIRQCCDLLALKAGESGLEIVIGLPPDLPELVADKRALRQMLLNLLSNAIKFTDRGGEVKVGAVVEADEIVITIADTGVGISEADLPRLGDAFFQARNTYDRPYGGTGLGLSIVKGLAELHGGRLEVHSRVGVGTTATLRLPLDCERSRPAAAAVVTLAPAMREDIAAAGMGRLLKREVDGEARKSA